MSGIPNWYFDESKPVGVDYTRSEVVRDYDQHHQKFRDFEKETQEIVRSLGLDKNSRILDMGAGAGAFALYAARYCKQVIAVDVSEAMLMHCGDKAKAMGLGNVSLKQGGFLTYQHQDEPLDAVVSLWALHHLPDHWKQAALGRMAQILKPSGRLLLRDVVLPSQVEDLDVHLEEWIRDLTDEAGDEMGQEFRTHLREEYSTFDWIMEGILERAGFSIKQWEVQNGFQTTYLCEKNER